MEKYRFTIEVSANTEAEAQIKINLLLELGAFLKDFNTNRLTSSFFSYLLLYLAEKYSPQVNDTGINKQR
jgi:hypothetical protein